MWWALLLPLVMELRPGLAEPPSQESVLGVTQQGSEETAGSSSTSSTCEGLSAAGTATLHLRNRSLELLPGCLPRVLSGLDASHNLLRALSAADLAHLPRLRYLTLSHNRIAELRWGPSAPEGLLTLDLSYNLLTALPPCTESALRNLSALWLVGNPLLALQPGAFSCLPALRLLNLSDTAIGRGDQPGLADGTFAGSALEVLDLSRTFLTQVEKGWMRDLSKLKSLHLREMPRLKSLQGDIFKMTPNLEQLDCQDSPELTSVHTHIFQDTPHLQLLQFQNCNLSSFPPWTLHFSQFLVINLVGNPLTCSCELSWLLMDAKRTVLNRPADTVCTPEAGASATFSAPLPLSQLPSVCHSEDNSTLHDSSSPSSVRPSPPSTAHQDVTKAVDHTGQAAWSHSTEGPGDPSSFYALNDSRALAGAYSTVGTELGESATRLVPETRSPAAATPAAPTSRDPWRTLEPDKGPRPTSQGTQESPSSGGSIPVVLLDDDEEEPDPDAGEEEGERRQDEACDYQPCRHLQTPCAELQRRSGCRCPGLSGEDAVPEPPVLRAVSETTCTSALIRWCAPSSVVRGYQIRYAAQGGSGNQSLLDGIPATARQHALHGLAPNTEYRVCVLAANAAGTSADQGGACGAFRTEPRLPPSCVALVAAAGLLLLGCLLLAVCLCRRARARDHAPRPHTRLVAYRNPAFDCR